MKKFFMSLLTIFLLALSTVSAAEDEEIDSETLLNDMRNNPKNYIYIGNFSNVGDAIYLVKSSVDVQEYNPPKYIIAVKLVHFGAGGFVRMRPKDTANLFGSLQFLYDYESKKINNKRTDETTWKYIDEKKAINRGSKDLIRTLAEAELAFYFAYDKYFYGEPISYQLKKYAEEGKGTFADRL